MSTEPQPSGTVVVLRDSGVGLEVLLLERAVRGEGRRPGPSVFPGGRVEPGDRQGADDEGDARLAAVREAREEAGLVLRAEALVSISRWITPDVSPRRFDTWFFLTRVARDVEIRVDGSEIGDHRWLSPSEALDRFRREELRLAPPTFVTVQWLVEHADSDVAQRRLARREIPVFRPRICAGPDGACILYTGDAGYEAGEPERPGPRHRLVMGDGGWRYDRSDEVFPLER